MKFVRDDPSDALVDRLAQVYLAHDTEIRPVLRALVGSAEFGARSAPRCATPARTSSRRTAPSASGRQAAGRRRRRRYAANAVLWQAASLGIKPFDWPRPDGQPIDNDAVVLAVADARVDERAPHHDRRLVAERRASPTARRRRGCRSCRSASTSSSTTCPSSCCTSARRRGCSRPAARPSACSRSEKITPDHGLVQWNMAGCSTTFLDSPAFLTR